MYAAFNPLSKCFLKKLFLACHTDHISVWYASLYSLLRPITSFGSSRMLGFRPIGFVCAPHSIPEAFPCLSTSTFHPGRIPLPPSFRHSISASSSCFQTTAILSLKPFSPPNDPQYKPEASPCSKQLPFHFWSLILPQMIAIPSLQPPLASKRPPLHPCSLPCHQPWSICYSWTSEFCERFSSCVACVCERFHSGVWFVFRRLFLLFWE